MRSRTNRPLSDIARRRAFRIRCVAAALSLALATTGLAISPGQWSQNTEADFVDGQTDGVVVTNLGDVKLAREITELGAIPEAARIIYDAQEMPNGDLYLAAGPEAKLLRFADGKAETVLQLKGEQIFALALDADGQLLVAVSGTPSRLSRLVDGKLEPIVELPDSRYIWDLAVIGNQVALATGTEGQLLLVDLAKAAEVGPKAPAKEEAEQQAADEPKADGEAMVEPAAKDEQVDVESQHPAVTVLLDATQPNLLCLGIDAKGRLYTGTDADGLIYRVTLDANQKAGETFVLFDAQEPEVGALLVLDDGTVYAGTADANQARPGRMSEAATTEPGRPDTGDAPPAGGAPMPAPGEGEPGDLPDPGEIPGVPPKPTPPPPPPPPGEGKPDETTEPAAEVAAPAVTAEQRDALRDAIRARLMSARQGGPMQVQAGARPMPVRRPTRPGAGPSPASGGQGGNAIYRISPDLFVSEVFRESVMILRILEVDGQLLVATGNEGQIFNVDPAADETTILAKLDVQQIPAMLRDRDGRVVLGTANPATLVELGSGYAASGTYTSRAFDGSQISMWGMFDLVSQTPEGTQISIETRSGNVADPDKAAWSVWSAPQVVGHDEDVTDATPRQVRVMSPPARFLQYRVTLEGQAEKTPVLGRVQIAYLVPNLRPRIASIQANYPDTPGHGGAAPLQPGQPRQARPGPQGQPQEGPMPTLTINWEASDPNSDTLLYQLHYQKVGDSEWLELAKDIQQPSFDWVTQKAPDGRYRVRVTASDGPSNPAGMAMTSSRVSDPIVIDNTPPAIEGIKIEPGKNGQQTIRATAVDAMSPIKSVEYLVDSDEQWQVVLPEDWIYDSTSEALHITLVDLSKGAHVVTMRVTDGRGNVKYEALRLDVK
jgi:hypothetical protein